MNAPVRCAAPVDLATALLTWGDGCRADLPWRATHDPWAVLVSEIMLQQTQTSRVAPRYTAFLHRFPSVAVCAATPAADILRAWAGLGYNRRALSLHRAAQAIVERHGGQVPQDLDALLALPGVGPYTARAVLAFGFKADHGVLDTNAARVLARAIAGRRLRRGEAQALADRLVPPGRARAWNHAVVDLGATVCTKRAPRCHACPVATACAWAASGHPAPDPADGTAGASTRQPPYPGSDRQGRGRLVAALRCGPVPLARVPDAAGWPDDPERARRVAAALVADGLAQVAGGTLALPT